MNPNRRRLSHIWMQVGPRLLPFADAATPDLPLGRLLRLSLFQVSVGMAIVLLNGTLNRVMIVELGVPTWLVAMMVSLPLLFAPFRVLVGHRSDNYRSLLGWKRVPFIWMGTMLQFGGLAIMPFALIILSGDITTGPHWVGYAASALAFLLVGIGLHTTQTAGLALATDLASEEARPRVVAMLYVMLLVGMGLAAVIVGELLADFSQLRLIKVIQGTAVATLVLNLIALWKQEVRDPSRTRPDRPRPTFAEAWADFMAGRRAGRLLVAVFLGTAAFSMQDILLEPYGGEILAMTVGETTRLTALFAFGTLIGFALAARDLGRGGDPCKLAAFGCVVGVFAFSALIFASPLQSAVLFQIGTVLIGLGGGMFAVGSLVAAMSLAGENSSGGGLALGAWGAVQATAAGGGIMIGGALRDIVSQLAAHGVLGEALNNPATGYGAVYHLELVLLFATLAVVGPLVRYSHGPGTPSAGKFGLAEFPG
jgi:BCD family chlorophyll transporter-like MFS transporter